MSVILAVVGAVLLAFVAPILGFLLGAFSGWIVGFVFPETFSQFFMVLYLGAFEPWQIGGMLGFVGGFFKSTSAGKS